MEYRYQKEKVFHNKIFGDDSRHNLGRIYSITEISDDFFFDYLCSISRGKKILEIGCGPGYKSFQLAQCESKVTGIDLSDVAVKMARQIAKKKGIQEIEFRVMNAEKLDFKNEVFDTICGSGILHHLNLNKAYPEIARTLKNTGKAVFIEPLGYNPMINLFRKLTPGLRTKDEHPLKIGDIKLAKKYFGEVEVHHFHFLTFLSVPFSNFPWFPNLLKTLSGFDRILFRFFPALKKYSWIVVTVFSK